MQQDGSIDPRLQRYVRWQQMRWVPLLLIVVLLAGGIAFVMAGLDARTWREALRILASTDWSGLSIPCMVMAGFFGLILWAGKRMAAETQRVLREATVLLAHASPVPVEVTTWLQRLSGKRVRRYARLTSAEGTHLYHVMAGQSVLAAQPDTFTATRYADASQTRVQILQLEGGALVLLAGAPVDLIPLTIPVLASSPRPVSWWVGLQFVTGCGTVLCGLATMIFLLAAPLTMLAYAWPSPARFTADSSTPARGTVERITPVGASFCALHYAYTDSQGATWHRTQVIPFQAHDLQDQLVDGAVNIRYLRNAPGTARAVDLRFPPSMTDWPWWCAMAGLAGLAIGAFLRMLMRSGLETLRLLQHGLPGMARAIASTGRQTTLEIVRPDGTAFTVEVVASYRWSQYQAVPCLYPPAHPEQVTPLADFMEPTGWCRIDPQGYPRPSAGGITILAFLSAVTVMVLWGILRMFWLG